MERLSPNPKPEPASTEEPTQQHWPNATIVSPTNPEVPAFDPFALGGRDREALSERDQAIVERSALALSAEPEADFFAALLARRLAIVDYVNATDLDPATEECKAAFSELNILEDQLFNAEPVGFSDLITQLRFLKTFIDEGFDFDEDCDRLLDRAIACAVVASDFAGWGAPLVDAPAVAASTAKGDKPLLAMISEEARLRELGIDARSRADRLLFAIRDKGLADYAAIAETENAGPIGSLYAEAKQYEEAAGDLFDRIAETVPSTVAGAIALLELTVYQETDPIVANALAGLRAIAAGGVG